MTQSYALAAITALLAVTPASGRTTGNEQAAVDAVFAEWTKPSSPGCAVAVHRDNRPLLTRTYGLADIEHRVPIGEQTVFEAGSTSKQFTAAALLLLAQDGKLAMSDSIRKHLPELPAFMDAVTLDQLVSHTGGVRDWGALVTVEGWPRGLRVHGNAEALDIIARQRALNFKPGSEYDYSNSGYILLTLAIERVSGESLNAFTRRRMFAPLGMADTQWNDDFRRIVANRATAYAPRETGHAIDMPFEDAYGHGRLLTTIGDLMRWEDGIATGRLGPALTRELERQARLDNGTKIAYARGLFVEQYRGLREVAHAGSTSGYQTWLGRYPDAKLSIGLMCNSSGANTVELAHRVADIYLSNKAADTVITPTPAALARRTGTYLSSNSRQVLQIASEAGGLTINGARLTAYDRERYAVGGVALQFRGSDLILRSAGDNERFVKVTPVQPEPRDLAAFAGDFMSDEALVRFTVIAAGDTLRVERHPGGGGGAVPADRNVFELKPVVKDGFQGREGMYLEFRRDAAGRVTGFDLSRSRLRRLAFRRVP